MSGSTADARDTAGDAATEPDAEHSQFAGFVHTSVLQNIVLADRKAGILFTLVSAALLFLFTRMPDGAASPVGALWLLGVGCLVASAALAFLVIFPRVRRPDRSLLFWGAIAAWPDSPSYVEAVCREDAASLARAKLTHCHELAGICARKFRLLRWSMLLAAAGLLVFLAALAAGLPSGGLGVPAAT